MSAAHKKLRDQVIVITGASSGIGLAIAEAAAKKHAKLVLAARSEQTLGEIAPGIADSMVADLADKQHYDEPP